MRKLNYFFCLMAGLLLSLTSCNSSEKVEPQQSPVKETTLEQYQKETAKVNKDLEQVALALSKLAVDHEVRAFLKAEALKQVDGDYDVFYAHAAQHRFSDGQTFAEKLVAQGIDISTIAASIPQTTGIGTSKL